VGGQSAVEAIDVVGPKHIAMNRPHSVRAAFADRLIRGLSAGKNDTSEQTMLILQFLGSGTKKKGAYRSHVSLF
jgi:hypothetical protein